MSACYLLRVATFGTRVQRRVVCVAPKIRSRSSDPRPAPHPRARKIFELRTNRATPSRGDRRPIASVCGLELDCTRRERPTFAARPRAPPAVARIVTAEPPEWILVDIRRIFACSFRTLSFSPYCITSRCTLHRWIILHTFSAADSRAETSHECYNDMLNFGTVLEHRYQVVGAWQTHGVKHGKRSKQRVKLYTNMFIRKGPTFGAVSKKGPTFGANMGQARKK
ncbi:uncharacterized protein LOC111350554 [Spodoptera litura]|uniref:Uncharacterized protein LOC111350554 n=1 Tax=Spodoptera litura TaxID=69820 RepID=A0A9J7INX2_SPOLT|nr:uncharacterized protein LOC111350554 [Spodoptera litura]